MSKEVKRVPKQFVSKVIGSHMNKSYPCSLSRETNKN